MRNCRRPSLLLSHTHQEQDHEQEEHQQRQSGVVTETTFHLDTIRSRKQQTLGKSIHSNWRTRLRKAALHHLHPVKVKLLLFLLILGVSKSLLLATFDALGDAAVCQDGDEKDEATNGTSDDDDPSGAGQRFPVLLDGVRFVEFFDDGRLAPLYQLLASYVRWIWGMEWRGMDVLSDLDALPRSTRVTICVVLGTGRKVLSVDLLNEHVEGGLVEVGLAASPFDDAWALLWVASGPDAEADGAGRLGILLTAESERVIVLEGADESAIDPPLKFFASPVCGVVVPTGLRRGAVAIVDRVVGHGIVDGAVV
jgi:hypothetical protein